MSDRLEIEIQTLKERNKKVEIDKAWETSLTRRISIFLITYFVAVLWLYLIDEKAIWLKAVVPAVGYILSTITIPQIKRIWINSREI